MIEHKAIGYALDLMNSNIPSYVFDKGLFFGAGGDHKGVSYTNWDKAGYPHIDELQITAGKGLLFIDLEICIRLKEEVGTLSDGVGESQIKQHQILYRVKNFSKRKFMKVYNSYYEERERLVQHGIKLLQAEAESVLAKTLEKYESNSL